MRVKTTPSDRAARVELYGEYDLSMADRLRLTLLNATTDRELVIVDLANVGFLDSSTIGVIMAASMRMQSYGGVLVIDGAQHAVLRVISTAGLADRLLLGRVEIPDPLQEELALLRDPWGTPPGAPS